MTLPQPASKPTGLYAAALSAGGLVTWETDLEAGTRTWTAEAARLFRIVVPTGVPLPLAERDHLREAMHEDDRPLLDRWRQELESSDEIEAHYRIRAPSGEVRFLRGRGVVMQRTETGAPCRVVHIIGDVTEQHRAEELRGYVIGELNHRMKNNLALIRAIASQTGRSSTSFDEFLDKFDNRISALARSVDRLIEKDWQTASLTETIEQEADALLDEQAARIEVDGPDIDIGSNAAQAIGLAVHELVVNAMKHGALGEPSGRACVRWRLDEEEGGREVLEMIWTETDGPVLDTAPATTGFGSLVTTRMLEATMQAVVTVDYRRDGLVWKMRSTNFR